MSFLGYLRADGSVGTRNFVGVIPTVSCANDVACWISDRVAGCATFLHGQGCAQTKPDLDIVSRTLINVGRNPNLASVLLVSLGCESVSAESIAQGIAESGKRVEVIRIQSLGGSTAAVARGCELAKSLAENAALASREHVEDSELIVGIKCGASDTTSGLAANPAAGAAADLIVERGGTCIFGETTEFIGAEHILVRRAISPAVGQRIMDIVSRMERRAVAMGADLRGGQPTAGNIAGGLTTIEEKSLGAIVKSGTKPIDGVLEYGERPPGKGLWIVDTPGREPEFLAALAAAGANVVIFTTGIGAPQGFPFIPVIKVTANRATSEHLAEHIDVLVPLASSERNWKRQAGAALLDDIQATASGRKTKAEICRYDGFPNIYTIGPVV